ncbi:hypothetical protein [Microvirga sp. CF3016]|uniref:hypothetical protein n=1 Tax=Microvirga sp. CF3016 TaxID=3110181 RepID=UPI002E7AA48D|nr:hypothetical protein [Microvirga sp. CF3016]MEE1611110.1 hypothetical protein [Microvirga sp. CF3016]
MAYRFCTGSRSRVTSVRSRTPLISIAVLNFRDRLIKAGGQVVEIGILDGEIFVDWLPVDADPYLEPLRASFLLPSPAAENDIEEKIQVLLDEPAIAALEDEAFALGAASLEAWRTRNGN